MTKKKGGGSDVVLHDRDEDPYEMTNVAGKRPKVVRELTAKLNGWLKKTGDPVGVV